MNCNEFNDRFETDAGRSCDINNTDVVCLNFIHEALKGCEVNSNVKKYCWFNLKR